MQCNVILQAHYSVYKRQKMVMNSLEKENE